MKVGRWISSMFAALAGCTVRPWLELAWSQTPPAPDTPDEATRVAKQVFAGSEFWWKRVETGTASGHDTEGFLARMIRLLWKVIQAIGDFIGWILRLIFGGFTGGFSGGSFVLWLILAGLLAWAAWKLAPLLLRWLQRMPAAPAERPVEQAEALADASGLFEQARQAHREGHHAEAIRLALLALIAHFEHLGLLRFDPTRTNREYQRELRPRTDLAAGFAQVARIYERVWYGRFTASRTDAEQVIELCGSVMARRELAPE